MFFGLTDMHPPLPPTPLLYPPGENFNLSETIGSHNKRRDGVDETNKNAFISTWDRITPGRTSAIISLTEGAKSKENPK